MQFIARTLASARTLLSRRHRLGLLALLVVGTGLLLAGCASTRPPPGVTAVTPFDVQRYGWSAQPPLMRPLSVDISDDDIFWRSKVSFGVFSAPFAALWPFLGALTPAPPCSKAVCAPSTGWTVRTMSPGWPCSWPAPGT